MPEEKLMPVRVAVRCRPLVPKEQNEGCQTCLTFIPGEPQLVLGDNKAFTYDYVFDPDMPQAKVYDDCVKTLIKGLFKGYNATVLAYGQTGSGKTYSMGGAYDTGSDDDKKGIIPRVIRELFDGISMRQENYDFVVKVSFLEIYKEELCDLLVPLSARVKDGVAIREDINGGIRLTGLLEKAVKDQQETVKCLETGAAGRTTGATSMNSTSSRSHAIFTIHLDRTSKVDSNDYFKAKFHLVDLAGSERAKKTQAEGERFKEGVNINRGLLALGNVISALGDETQKRTHIPYRDSKLTRILQDSLGGNSNTLMIACVSPADSNMEETLSTLRYADRARKIKNKPIVNRDPQAAEIMRLKALVQQLQNTLAEKGGALPIKTEVSRSSLNSSIDTSVYKDVITKLEEENGRLKEELVNAIHQNTAMYEKMVSVEAINDKLKENLESLKEKTGLSLSLLDANPEMQEKIKEIQEHITEMETIHESKLDESQNTDSTEHTDKDKNTSVDGGRRSSVTPYTTEDVLKEAQLKNKMYALNDMLDQKEALLKEINSNNMTFNVFHEKYEAELKERESQITELAKEKDELSDKLFSAKAALNTTKVGEQRRQRVKELETKITGLQRENREQMKLLRMKESSAKDSQRLAKEIQDLKKQRVQLMKTMKAEGEASRKWKQKKEKEVLQLKAKERKQQVEFQKMERMNVQQQAVLRRKGEEAAAANRRLKEALMRQKQVLADRANKQVRHDANTQAKFKKWLDNELELVVSVEENRHHLEQMQAQRKELTSRITHLNEELAQPPTKKKMMDNSQTEETDESKQKVEAEIAEAREDLKYLNQQISETQQRIVEADQDERSKTRWEEVKTLMDARTALRLLLDKAVKAQVERLQELSKAVDAQAELEDKDHQLAGLQQKVSNLKDQHNRQVTALHQDAQRRLGSLLALLNEKVLSQAGVEAAGKLTREELEKLSALQDELEKKTDEVDNLQKKLIKSSIKQRVGDTSYFGHLDSTPKMEVKGKKQKKKTANEEVEYDDYDIPGTPYTPGLIGDDEDSDPNWEPTKPSFRVPRNIKRSQLFPSTGSTPTEDSNDDTLNVTNTSCGCKGDCSTNRCKCTKNSQGCTDKCKCKVDVCTNRDKEDEDEENTASTLNSTFVMGAGTSTPNDSVNTPDSEPEPPKRKSSGVKRNSAGVPRDPLIRLQVPSNDSSLNSSDDFMDTTFTNKKKKIRKPFFKNDIIM